MKNLHLHYTPTVLIAIAAAVISIGASFGLHLSHASSSAILTLVGLVAGGLVIGGGVKSGAMLRAGLAPVGTIRFHFTSASVVAAIGAIVTLAATFGFHVSPTERDAILKLVGLIAGGIVIGGAAKSAGALAGGVHPLQRAIDTQANSGNAQSRVGSVGQH